jgi:hypothetical protein
MGWARGPEGMDAAEAAGWAAVFRAGAAGSSIEGETARFGAGRARGVPAPEMFRGTLSAVPAATGTTPATELGAVGAMERASWAGAADSSSRTSARESDRMRLILIRVAHDGGGPQVPRAHSRVGRRPKPAWAFQMAILIRIKCFKTGWFFDMMDI